MTPLRAGGDSMSDPRRLGVGTLVRFLHLTPLKS